MIAMLKPVPINPEAYLAWEETQDLRYEYLAGEVWAMTGSTLPHNDIALNLYSLLRPIVKAKGCRMNLSDVKVQVDATTAYFYPDLVISCDDRDVNAIKWIQAPTVVVEVLSPSTESRDRGKKFWAYQSMASLQEYVLIDARRIAIEVYRRGEGRLWLYYPYRVGDVFEIESFGFSCPIEQVYEDVSLDMLEADQHFEG